MPRNITRVPQLPKLEQKKRVAAYARVSSGKDAMLHSLSAQVSYYSDYIQNRNDWLYVGVYADEATTGTKDNRDGFQGLLADCRAGKVDMVITKSISRFARNTVTLLQTVREFKALGVDIFFEEQNIHTLSNEGELMMTILASYAQEESRSASENQKWRIRKNFEEGMPWNGTILGYRYINGVYSIIPEEAEIIKSIFTDYLSGMGTSAIAKKLNANGILTRKGNIWGHTAVTKVLKDEAYTGNLLLQKTYRENHITKRMLINQGELPMYSAEATHEAIICQEMFDAVQTEMACRSEKSKKTGIAKQTYPFTGKMVCSICGKNYMRKPTPSGPVWICSTFNLQGKTFCASKQIPEDTLLKVSAEVLGATEFDERYFNEYVCSIIVSADNTLVYSFKDDAEIKKQWKDRPRSQSWTEEMRAEARKRALERRQKQCQK
jgi:DNA invertase Pin-like site-specific DNA recombinase